MKFAMMSYTMARGEWGKPRRARPLPITQELGLDVSTG